RAKRTEGRISAYRCANTRKPQSPRKRMLGVRRLGALIDAPHRTIERCLDSARHERLNSAFWFEPLAGNENSQFNVRCRLSNVRPQSIVGKYRCHPGKNASRPIRRHHRLYSLDTSSAHLPASSKSHLHWDRMRSLRWQSLPAMEAQVFLRDFQMRPSVPDTMG